MVSHTTLTRIRWGCFALNFIFINVYFIISLLWSSFVFVVMFPAYAIWAGYVPILLWLRFRKSKHTWDRAGAEVAYLSLQSATWLCVAVLGIEYRGPSFCAEWSYDQGWLDGSDPHSPFIDTNTGIQHSCDVDVLMNVIACLHLLMLLVWMAWIIYEVRRLPFAKSERRIAFRCGVSRILNGDYDLPGTRRDDRWSDSRGGRGGYGGKGGQGASSRRTSVDAKTGDVELGNMSGSGVAGTDTTYNSTTITNTNTDTGTHTGTGTDTSMSVGTGTGGPASYLGTPGYAGPAHHHNNPGSRSPAAVSPTGTDGTHPRAPPETTHTNLVPPLPPRPVLRPPIGSASNSGLPTSTTSNPGASSSATDLPRRESQVASDIPPPAYEHNGTNNPEPGTATSPSGSSTWRTMDFDSFMRAQQHKAEYKLFLEQQERRAANGEAENRGFGASGGAWAGDFANGTQGVPSPSGSGWGGNGSGGRMENGRRRRGSY